MIFDIKMEDWCHEAWLISWGNMSKAPTTLIIFSNIAVLNDIGIQAAGVITYIPAPCGQKIWTTLGKDFLTSV